MKTKLFLASLLASLWVNAQDGNLDATFNSAGPDSGFLYATAIDSNDKIYVGGNFTSFDGVPIEYIARLNPNGSLDNTFSPSSYSTYDEPSGIKILADNEILMFGNTYNSSTGVTHSFCRKYLTNGAFNGTFETNAFPIFNAFIAQLANVHDVLELSNGKLLVSYSHFNGSGPSNVYTSYDNKIIRLNADGTLDNTFNVVTFDQPATDIEYFMGTNILVAGRFSTVNGVSRQKLFKMNENGVIDVTFSHNLSSSLNSAKIVVRPDNSIVFADSSTITTLNSTGIVQTTESVSSTYNCIYHSELNMTVVVGNNTSFKRITNSNAIDSGFNIGTGPNTNIRDIAKTSTNNYIIVGQFTSYNGTSVNKIARIIGNTTLTSNHFEENKFSLYPNPVENQFTITSSNNEEIKTIEIYNIQGQLVKTESNLNIISTENLTPGFYLAKLTSYDGKEANIKFLKK